MTLLVLAKTFVPLDTGKRTTRLVCGSSSWEYIKQRSWDEYTKQADEWTDVYEDETIVPTKMEYNEEFGNWIMESIGENLIYCEILELEELID